MGGSPTAAGKKLLRVGRPLRVAVDFNGGMFPLEFFQLKMLDYEPPVVNVGSAPGAGSRTDPRLNQSVAECDCGSPVCYVESRTQSESQSVRRAADRWIDALLASPPAG